MRLEGFEPPTRGLGIRGDVLHRIAESCESCISKPFFLLRLAQYCGTLRSRWRQSGLNCTASFPAQIKGRRFGPFFSGAFSYSGRRALYSKAHQPASSRARFASKRRRDPVQRDPSSPDECVTPRGGVLKYPISRRCDQLRRSFVSLHMSFRQYTPSWQISGYRRPAP